MMSECREPGCKNRIWLGAPEPTCFFHGHDLVRDERGRFQTWGMRMRTAFKGGSWKMEMVVKGYEVDRDWLKAIDADPKMLLAHPAASLSGAP